MNLSYDENEHIIAEKESLEKTLEVLKSLKFTLENDPEYEFSSFLEPFNLLFSLASPTPNPQDEGEKVKESQEVEVKEPKPKGKGLFDDLFQPSEKKKNSFAPKGQEGENPFNKSTEQNKNNPFAPKKGLFG